MMRFLNLKAWALLGATALALPSYALSVAPPVQAVISYDTQSDGHDGVTHQSHYQESWIRQGQTVWSARVRTPAQRAIKGHASDGHDHPDVAIADKITTPSKTGQATHVLAFPDDKLILDLRETDYEDVGLSGCWPCAYYLISPDQLKRMSVIKKEGALTTYQQKTARGTTTVQWDQNLQVPRWIEVRANATNWTRMTLTPTSQPTLVMPWARYRGFTHRDLADLGD